jgi:RHS repeat-associated protein
VHGPAQDEPLVWYEGAGTSNRRFLHADERGSIIAVSDDGGNLVGINRYDEYGMGASENVGRFQYTGQRWLPELGLYDYKARMYDPALGRFLQPDPAGYDDGMNGYAYVGNDPVNMFDPTGLQGCGGRTNSTCPQDADDDGGIVVRGTRMFNTSRQFVKDLDTFQQQMRQFADELKRYGIRYALYEVGLVRKPTAPRPPKPPKWGCGCLEAGTLVATPFGLRPIEDIGVGQLVLAKNEETGEIAPKPVTELIQPSPKALYAVKVLDAGGKTRTFHATDDQPWKVHSRGWVETPSLMAGDRIVTGSGADLIVTSLILTDRIEPTYSLTVADWHTFMIGEGAAVVHNACNPFKSIPRLTGKLLPDWGVIIGWGTGPKEAAKRLREINPDEVDQMRTAGLTKEAAILLRDAYQWAEDNGKGPEVASERKLLMDNILRNWWP